MRDQPPAEPTPFAYEPPDPDRPASGAATEEAADSAPVSTLERLGPYAAWKHRPFTLFSTGFAAALIGGQIQSAAIAWEIFSHGQREIDLGWLGLVQAIPVMLFALPAGYVADHFDRRRVVIVGQIISLLCSIALAVLSYHAARGTLAYGWFYLPLFISSAAFTFNRAARHAMLPALVPAKVFTNAVTWNSSIFELSQVIGPNLGGIVIALQYKSGQSLWIAYALAVLGQLLYIAFLAFMRLAPIAETRHVIDRGIASGIRFVWRTKIILATITLDLFAVLLGGATYMLPAVAVKVLHVGPIGFCLLRAAPSIGAITMAFLQAHLPPMKRAGPVLLWSVAAFGLATIGFGLSTSFLLSMILLFFTGAFDNISVVIRHTLVQVLTPDAMRGRVSAVNNVFIGASNELGGWESGVTAQYLGLVPSIIAGGIGTLAVVGLVAVVWPQIRRFGSLHDAAVADGTQQ
jgi:MFS family permease